jgi:serine/threonine protein kinase
MPLPAGARFGSYEIVDLLGAGGMGEVYRARDLKLGREVALKLASPTQVSLRGGIQPQWRRDSKELFYATLDGNIMSAAVSETAGQLQRATPTMLFAPNVNVFDGFRSRFTVTSDGQRFLVLKPVVDRRLSPITAVINWTEQMSPR